jgi:signal transduction histidine kinase
VPVSLTVPTASLPVEIEAAAYFVCSEALANVAKYASASRAVVVISLGVRTVAIEVADDGNGGADAALGSGLRGLNDRVEALGGTLRIASPHGGGTRLEVDLPVAVARR